MKTQKNVFFFSLENEHYVKNKGKLEVDENGNKNQSISAG